MHTDTEDVAQTPATLVTRMLLLMTASGSLSTTAVLLSRHPPSRLARETDNEEVVHRDNPTLVRHRRFKELLHCTRTCISFRRVTESTTKNSQADTAVLHRSCRRTPLNILIREKERLYPNIGSLRQYTFRCSKKPQQPKLWQPKPGEQRQYNLPPPADLD